MSAGLVADIQLRRGAFALNARFETPHAGVTALFGPSGAGKSLLLSALAGLHRIEAGRITFGDRVLDDAATRTRTPAHLRGIGLVFQDARLLPHLSVRANLEYAFKRAPPHRQQVTITDVAEHFDIAALLDRAVRNLSGGERSRVALARAILSKPDLLLLDEPFAALDGARRRSFLSVLRDMHRTFSMPMLVVTHQIEDVAALADHVIGLRRGAVVAAGPLAPTVANEAFQTLLDVRDVGSAVRLGASAPSAWIRADHVLLASVPPVGLSARHVWQARILEITAEDEGSVLVRLDTEVGPMFARVTPAAAAELGLTQDGVVWAIVKAHAM
jgi:molybdate transport system ATP-binding protein